MKKQLQKKLYSLIITAMMFTVCAKAQIVYTDVNPDTISSSAYNLDLNNDGISDFILSKANIGPAMTVHCVSCNNNFGYTVRNSTISIQALGSNKVGLNGASSKLDLNTLIDSNALSWSTSISLSTLSFSTTGQCIHVISSYRCVPKGGTFSGNWGSGGTDKYLGLRIKVGSALYYGWVRLTVNGTSSFTVKDYAFNTIANQSILAGQTCSPLARINASSPLSFCSGGSVVLTSQSSGNSLKYQWKKNNVNISGGTNKNYTATTAGNYKVIVTDTINNCNKTSGILTVTVPCRLTNEVVTDQLESPYDLKIAPNPLSNSTTISFSLEQSEKVTLKVFDLNGRLIKTLANNSFEEGKYSIEWSADKVNAGIYFLKMQSGENLQTEK